jgi:hypothetical protein
MYMSSGLDQIAAHRHDGGGGAGRQVQAAKEFQARAFYGALQRPNGGGTRRSKIVIGRPFDHLGVRLHRSRKEH